MKESTLDKINTWASFIMWGSAGTLLLGIGLFYWEETMDLWHECMFHAVAIFAGSFMLYISWPFKKE